MSITPFPFSSARAEIQLIGGLFCYLFMVYGTVDERFINKIVPPDHDQLKYRYSNPQPKRVDGHHSLITNFFFFFKSTNN